MTSIVVDTSARSQADEERTQAQDFLAVVRDSAITSDADEAAAVEAVREAKARIAQIEETRKFFVDPLNKVVKTYNNFFRSPREVWEECERLLKSKIAVYVREKNEANQRALAAAAKTSDAEEARDVLATITPATNPKGTSIRYEWVFEVVDPDRVPREFCSPDLKKLGHAFAVGEGSKPMEIPGVVWSQRPIMSVRRS